MSIRPFVLAALALALVAAERVLHGLAVHHGTTTALFVVVRMLTFLLAPGFLLAAAAELLAYVLVGPRR